jgi:formylglycine-generating enzyme required for sulfatase activity
MTKQSASSVVAAGTAAPGAVAQPTAAGSNRASRTTSSDSDHPSDWLRDDESERASRGGSWYYNAGYCRAAYRFGDEPGCRCYDLGFRPSFRLAKR